MDTVQGSCTDNDGGLMDTILESSIVIDTIKWTLDEVKYAIDAVHQSVAAGCANDQPKKHSECTHCSRTWVIV